MVSSLLSPWLAILIVTTEFRSSLGVKGSTALTSLPIKGSLTNLGVPINARGGYVDFYVYPPIQYIINLI